MRRTTILTCAFLGLFLASTAWGQPGSVLGQLEQRLRGAVGNALDSVPGPASGAPGTGYLGAMLDDANEQGRGVRVTSVKAGAPAATSGLKDNDLITAIDGKPINGLTPLDAILDKAVPGQKLKMTVERAGRIQAVDVTLGARQATGDTPPAETPPTTPSPSAPSLTPPGAPSASPPGPSFSPPTSPSSPSLLPPGVSSPSTLPPATDSGAARTPGIQARPFESSLPPADIAPDLGGTSSGGASLGISVIPLNDQTRLEAGFPVRRGAYIAVVKPGSAAEQAQLPVGGLIVRMNSKAIDSDEDLIQAVRAARAGQDVELQYYLGNRLMTKTVRLAAAGGTTPPSSPSSGLGPTGGGFASELPPPVSGATSGLGRPLGSGSMGFGGGSAAGNRPLLQRIEQMAGNLTRPTGTTTVYDPLAMAALQTRVVELGEQVKALEERLKALEGKAGITAPSIPSSNFSSPITPGFGTAPAPITPGFGTPPGPVPSNP